MKTFDPPYSYLQIYFPRIDLDYTLVYEINNNGWFCVWTGKNVDHKKCSCLVVMVGKDHGQACHIFHRQLQIFLDEYLPEHLHVLFRPVSRKQFSWARIQQICQARRSCRHGSLRSFQYFGFKGDPEHPEMIVPLNKNVLSYVATVVFRHHDSPLKVLAKRIFISLLGEFSWNDYMIIAASREDAFAGPDEVNGTADLLKFAIITDDRKIFIVFHENVARPHKVVKIGKRDEIYAEYQNCVKACKLLGDSVPQVYGYNDGREDASLLLECIREVTMSNVVASHFFFRRKVFIRTVVELFDFFLFVFKRFVGKGPLTFSRAVPEDMAVIRSSLAAVGRSFPDSSMVEKVFVQMSGMEIPWILQHGDFCPRNILFADNKRKVLIDWEDMREKQWPFMDLAMLLISLKEHYVFLFKDDSAKFLQLPAVRDKFAETKQLACLALGIEIDAFYPLLFLSTAALCRQNFLKNRIKTARMIYRDLLSQAVAL